MKQKALFLAKLCVSGLLIWLLSRQIDMDSLLVHFYEMNRFYLALSFAALIIQGLHGGYLWMLILRKMGAPVGFWPITQVNLIGGFFGFFVPSSLGVDLVRTIILSRHLKSIIVVAGSTLVLRGGMFLALLTLGFFGGIQAVREGQDSALIFPVIGTYIGLVAAFLLFFNTKVQKIVRTVLDRFRFHNLFEKLYQLYTTILDFRNDRKFLCMFLLSAMANQVINVLTIYLAARAVGIENVGFAFFIIYVPVVLIVTMLPISVAGIGVREGAFVVIFSFAGIASSQALAVSLILFAETILYAALGGIVYLFRPFDLTRVEKTNAG